MYDMEALESFIAVLGGLLILFVLIMIAYLVFYYVGAWKFYKKTGREGWKAIIPYYNQWVLVEMVGLKWYWFLILNASTIIGFFGDLGFLGTLCSIVSLAASINVGYNISKKLNKSVAFGVVFGIFTGILLPILGFSNSTVWNETAPVTGDGLIDNFINKNNANNQNVQPNMNSMQQPMQQNVQQPMQQNMQQQNVGNDQNNTPTGM